MPSLAAQREHLATCPDQRNPSRVRRNEDPESLSRNRELQLGAPRNTVPPACWMLGPKERLRAAIRCS